MSIVAYVGHLLKVDEFVKYFRYAFDENSSVFQSLVLIVSNYVFYNVLATANK